MKRLYFSTVFVLIVLISAAQVQDWGWVRSGNGSADENSNHMAIDNSGNIIITGKFSSPTATLSSVTLTNSGASTTSEFLLAKYNQAGALQWAKRAQGLDNDEGIAVTTDGSGNIYVAGNYDSPTITFGTITLSNTSTFSDFFLVKYDGSGNVLWARTYGGNLLDDVRSLRADNSGNTYMTGSFRSLSLQFGNFGVINAGNSDAYLTKTDPNGTSLWAKQIGGTANDNGLAVTHDGSGNIYLAGDFTSTVLTTYNLSNAGGTDMFLSKYDASGNFLLSKVIGGSSNETVNYLETDASGNLYLAGSYQSSSLNLTTVTLTNGSTRDMALLKMNNSLVVQWARRVSGNLSSNPTGLFIDQSSNLFMTGSYDISSLNFGSNSLTNPSSALEGFIVRYDLSGTDQWVKSTNASSDQEARGVVVDNLGSIYVTGVYTNSLVLGGNNLSTSGGKELYLAKICALPTVPVATSNVTVCPKKNGVLSVTTTSGVAANWYSSATGGTPLVTGSNSYTAASTSTFYVEATNIATGCSNPSRTAVSLFVQPSSTVSVTGKTLTASAGTSFKWIECVKDSVLTGQTGQTYVVVKTGNYAVIVTNNGCTDTSACKFYSVTASGTVTVPNDTLITSLPQQSLREFDLLVYPNPNDGSFYIRSTSESTLTIINIVGQPIVSFQLSPQNNFTYKMEGLTTGIYFLASEEKKFHQRIVVTR